MTFRGLHAPAQLSRTPSFSELLPTASPMLRFHKLVLNRRLYVIQTSVLISSHGQLAIHDVGKFLGLVLLKNCLRVSGVGAASSGISLHPVEQIR